MVNTILFANPELKQRHDYSQNCWSKLGTTKQLDLIKYLHLSNAIGLEWKDIEPTGGRNKTTLPSSHTKSNNVSFDPRIQTFTCIHQLLVISYWCSHRYLEPQARVAVQKTYKNPGNLLHIMIVNSNSQFESNAHWHIILPYYGEVVTHLIYVLDVAATEAEEMAPKSLECEPQKSNSVLPPVIDCKTIQTARNCYDEQGLFIGSKWNTQKYIFSQENIGNLIFFSQRERSWKRGPDLSETRVFHRRRRDLQFPLPIAFNKRDGTSMWSNLWHSWTTALSCKQPTFPSEQGIYQVLHAQRWWHLPRSFWLDPRTECAHENCPWR